MTITAELPYGYGIPTANKFTLPNVGKLVAKIIPSRNEDIEVPTQYLLDSLKKSEADEIISFSSGKDALNYLDEMIANDKRNR